MRILHSSDWHLGKRLESFSRLEEQKEVMNEICEIADRENVDAVLIAGDLFDNYNPPTEAVELFFKTLKRLSNNGKRAVIAIAGNHDSPDRIEAPDPLARECGIIFAGYPNVYIEPFELETGLKVLNSEKGFVELKLPECEETLRVIMTPYANEYRLKTYLGCEDTEVQLNEVLDHRWNKIHDKYCDEEGVNVLLTHLFMVNDATKRGVEDWPEEPEEEMPILHIGGSHAVDVDCIPPLMHYVALGHLHRKQFVGEYGVPTVYSGSPLSYSFSEANQDKYVIIADIIPERDPYIREVKLETGKPLVRKRVNGVYEALEFLKNNQEALVELTVVTDNYLTAEERRMINASHKGIVSIIPEVRSENEDGDDYRSNIDLTKGMQDLFIDYFKHAKGQIPNDKILDLFKEVLSKDDEEEYEYVEEYEEE